MLQNFLHEEGWAATLPKGEQQLSAESVVHRLHTLMDSFCLESELFTSSFLETLQRVLLLHTWTCDELEYFTPRQVVAILKNEFGEFCAPYDDDDARAMFEMVGCDGGVTGMIYGHLRNFRAFEWFSSSGNLKMCEWLYANGAADDISRVSDDEYTPLYGAVVEKRVRVVEWLLKRGVDVNTKHHSESILLTACLCGCLPVVQTLFDSGAVICVNDACLGYACWAAHKHVMTWLVESGNTGATVDRYGRTPLIFACLSPNPTLGMVQWLFEHTGARTDVSRPDSSLATPLRYLSNQYTGDDCHEGSEKRETVNSICHYLVKQGALNDESGNVSKDMVRLDIVEMMRLHFREWTQLILTAHSIFYGVFLPACVVAPTRRISPRRRCHLPKLSRGPLGVVASFVGVLTGRPLRNVRQLNHHLT